MEGNGQKLSHIDLSNSVISYFSNSGGGGRGSGATPHTHTHSHTPHTHHTHTLTSLHTLRKMGAAR